MTSAPTETPDVNPTRWSSRIAILAATAIAVHLLFRFAAAAGDRIAQIPLLVALATGGAFLVFGLFVKLLRRQFSSDLLAGISIVTAVILHEYLAGTFVVLMLSGGEALESFAVRSASSVLAALARRMPNFAHRRTDSHMEDVPLDRIAVGDTILILPHETCPVDGTVVEGHSVMDESYLTGEPFQIPKAPGADVISGSINGQSLLAIRATRLAADSRYAHIMRVMRASEQDRPRLRRLGDQLGAFYTPLSVLLAIAAWIISRKAERFLAVLVVATPCPLLIAIPVAVIGAISLAARRGIIIKRPIVLEQIASCRTMIFDKTGTLTYGKPVLSEPFIAPGFEPALVLSLAASLERYSKHPLATAVLDAARRDGLALSEATAVSEPPGQGLSGIVSGKQVLITARAKLAKLGFASIESQLPPAAGGMECVVLIDNVLAGTFRFRDEPRVEGGPFVRHLTARHHVKNLILLSGDRASEVAYLAEKVGITRVYAEQSPEQKLAIVQAETAHLPTLYVGDGINDAPALAAATVGIALGRNSDVTGEAAGAVILDSSLTKVDELLHIGRRMRRIALQSAVGGMALSVVGMGLAAVGLLPPVAGAIFQEIIDVLAVLNALRAAFPPKSLTDF